MALPKSTKIISAVLLVVSFVGAFHLNRPASSASMQSTQDAYVQADYTTVAPQVSGRVDKVLIEDNQLVKAGELMATIDDRDFVVAVDAAKAQVEGAQANIVGLQARLALQETAIRQARAAVQADEASLRLAKTHQARHRNLAADGSGTVQALQQADAQLSIQLAAGEKNLAGLQAARQQVGILQADLEKAKAALSQADSALAAAELKLSRTRVVAPIGGTIGQKAVRVGAFVNEGKPLLAIVPLDAVYVAANFRETQLAQVRPGDSVDIEVDALPGEALKGTVQSLGPASGASYSAIAPHNATGNFTKIVQRLPVRITIEPDQPAAKKLRVGMSVTPRIRVGGPLD